MLLDSDGQMHGLPSKAERRTSLQKPEEDSYRFSFVLMFSGSIQHYKNYHEDSNKRPDSDVKGVVEVVADPGEGDPEGEAHQAGLLRK